MALSPRDQQHYETLLALAASLKEAGQEGQAASVDLVLGPLGPGFTQRVQDHLHGSRNPVNFPIKMRKSFRDVIRPVDPEEQKRRGQENLDEILDDGFRRFLAGEFEVRQERAPRGTSATDPSVVMTVRPDGRLLTDVGERVREMPDSSGRQLSLTGLAAAILFEHFGLGPYAPVEGAE